MTNTNIQTTVTVTYNPENFFAGVSEADRATIDTDLLCDQWEQIVTDELASLIGGGVTTDFDRSGNEGVRLAAERDGNDMSHQIDNIGGVWPLLSGGAFERLDWDQAAV